VFLRQRAGSRRPGGDERAGAQRQRPRRDDVLHHERRLEPADARDVRERAVVELLEGGEVAAHDPQQVVGVAEQALCLEDLRHLDHRRLEAEAEQLQIDLGVIAGDDAAGLQRAQPAVRRGRAEVDPLGELGDGEPAIQLEFGKNLLVQVVDHEIPSTIGPESGDIRDHFAPDPS